MYRTCMCSKARVSVINNGSKAYVYTCKLGSSYKKLLALTQELPCMHDENANKCMYILAT